VPRTRHLAAHAGVAAAAALARRGARWRLVAVLAARGDLGRTTRPTPPLKARARPVRHAHSVRRSGTHRSVLTNGALHRAPRPAPPLLASARRKRAARPLPTHAVLAARGAAPVQRQGEEVRPPQAPARQRHSHTHHSRARVPRRERNVRRRRQRTQHRTAREHGRVDRHVDTRSRSRRAQVPHAHRLPYIHERPAKHHNRRRCRVVERHGARAADASERVRRPRSALAAITRAALCRAAAGIGARAAAVAHGRAPTGGTAPSAATRKAARAR
jgi:hypothetical protein